MEIDYNLGFMCRDDIFRVGIQAGWLAMHT